MRKQIECKVMQPEQQQYISRLATVARLLQAINRLRRRGERDGVASNRRKERENKKRKYIFTRHGEIKGKYKGENKLRIYNNNMKEEYEVLAPKKQDRLSSKSLYTPIGEPN
jgi:hypothetical protein